MTAFTCYSRYRGTCGVHHKTEAAAVKHCDQMESAIKRHNGSNSYGGYAAREIAQEEAK